MSAVLPHYKMGPANFQVASLVYGGQLVSPHVPGTAGTTDFTVIPVPAGGSASASQVNGQQCLGVAGNDANVITTQTGAANSYGQPQIDISTLTDYVSVWYGGVDIWVWYGGQALYGELLVIGATTNANTNGTVQGLAAGSTPLFSQVVGRCTQPGGVPSANLTQQIGGQGTAAYYLARARIF